MNISELQWFVENETSSKTISECLEAFKEKDGGILVQPGIMTLEIDRRIIKYDAQASQNDELMKCIFTENKTATFEGEFKTVFIYLAPSESDIPHLRQFSKRGMAGMCYQEGFIPHQKCAGPKWVHSGGNEILPSPRKVLELFFKLPSLTAQAKTAVMAFWDAAKNDSLLKTVSDEVFSKRKAICLDCEYYDASAFLGSGRCRVCGCGVAKLKMPTQECPKGKWGKVAP